MLASLFRLFLFLLLMFAGYGCRQENTHQTPATTADGPPLFTLLASGQTGVAFQNTLTEGLNTNILMYGYF